MANLYLIDRPFGENGLNLALGDPGATVVLLQDGVYLDPTPALQASLPVLAVQDDVAKRGLEDRVAAGVRRIDYGELVDLIVDHKVVNFA
jgi:tRNA 2-thiouridine synthesizing protein B